ncbi:MAG: MBL fold metallo-hydrolase [Proteobacteria bacterium]|nr:MBL fold metallo-hydrolase [Pseudomonadota bacterium]
MTTLPSWLTLIKLPMPSSLGAVKVYLIRGPNGAALIDTGMNDATSRKELINRLADLGLGLSDIDTVVCTHYHADHAGLGKTVTEAGADTMMSAIDARSLETYFSQPEQDDARVRYYGRHEVPDDYCERVIPIFPFFRKLAEQFEPKIHLEDGEELDLAGIRFTVMVTPGHTRGHVCLKHDDGIVFTGDCVTSADATHISMRSDVIGTNPLGGFFDSLERLGDLGPVIGLPGHGPLIGDLSTQIGEIVTHHRTRLGQVENTLQDAPQTAFNLSIEAMGPRPKAFARWLAMGQTLAYLEYLISCGRAEKLETETGTYYRIGSPR